MNAGKGFECHGPVAQNIASPGKKSSPIAPSFAGSVDSFRKWIAEMVKNPVMFVSGSRRSTDGRFNWMARRHTRGQFGFGLQSAWLWFTVCFANFAEKPCEGRGKAQADTLHKIPSRNASIVCAVTGSIAMMVSFENALRRHCVRRVRFLPGRRRVVTKAWLRWTNPRSRRVQRRSSRIRRRPTAVTGGSRAFLSAEIKVRHHFESG